jgi:diguanylate cyclase (GGDEF)-like protein
LADTTQPDFADRDFTDVTATFQALSPLDQEAFKTELGQLSQFLRAEGDTELAMSYLTQVPENWSESRRARATMVLYYDNMALANFNAIYEHLSSQIQRWQDWYPSVPDDVTSKGNLLHIYGQLLVRKDKIDQALAYFNQAEMLFYSVDENHTSIWTIQVIIGEAYLKAGYYRKSLEYLEKALEIFPEARKGDARSYLAGLLAKATLQTDGKEKALAVIADYLAKPIDPRQDYFLYFSLVHLEVLRQFPYTMNFLELASETYKLAETINNADYLKDATAHLGYALYKEGNIEESIDLLERAISGESDIRDNAALDAFRVLSLSYAFIGQYDQAYEALQTYIELDKRRQTLLKEQSLESLAVEYDLLRAENAADRAQLEMKIIQERTEATEQFDSLLNIFIVILVLISSALLFALLAIRQKNKQLAILSTQDPLTRAGNRHAMMQWVDKHQPKTVSLVDIDHLKYYNDEMGHAEGDRLIKTVVDAFRIEAKHTEFSFFRIGGDEFVLLSKTASVTEIASALTRCEQHLHEKGFYKSGLSFGACSQQAEQSFSQMLSEADTKMYQMKTEKRLNR